jgi:hypothetical protein
MTNPCELIPAHSLDQVRQYLGALETVAHMGKAFKDPREVIAALEGFVEPSDVLRRLAERSRRLSSR